MKLYLKNVKQWKYVLASCFFMMVLLLGGCGGIQASSSESTSKKQMSTKKTDQESNSNKVINEEDATSLPNQIKEEELNVSEDVEEETLTSTRSNMKVTFLDVGEGNATLVEIDGKYMLIDGGDREYSSFVVSYLKQQGVEALDYVVVSHYDADHLNGIVGALHAFTIGTVIAPDYTMDTRVFHSFVNKLEELGIHPIAPKIGDTFNFMGATIEIVGPTNYNNKDVNDNSIMVRLTNGKNRFLFTADAEEDSEKQILAAGIDVQADVMNIGHHGSSSSSTNAFLDVVKPTYGVISVGEGNSYGHPTTEVLNRIKERQIQMFRTDKQGTIVANSDGENITWNVEPSTDDSSGEKGRKETATQDSVDEKQMVPSSEAESVPTNENLGVANTQNKTYILNTNTHKYHDPSCHSVKRIKPENYEESNSTSENLIQQGYEACKICNPS